MASGHACGRVPGEPSKGSSSPTSPSRNTAFRLLVAALVAVVLLTPCAIRPLNSEDSGPRALEPPQGPLASPLRASFRALQSSTSAALSRLGALPDALFRARWLRVSPRAPLSSRGDNAPVASSSSGLRNHGALEGLRVAPVITLEQRTGLQGPSSVSEETSEPRRARLLSSDVAPKRRMLRRFDNFSTGISSVFTHHAISELLAGGDTEGMQFRAAAMAADKQQLRQQQCLRSPPLPGCAFVSCRDCGAYCLGSSGHLTLCLRALCRTIGVWWFVGLHRSRESVVIGSLVPKSFA